ncbi:hypothetical protein ACQKRQ_38310 [Paraburkholderia sp. NPDC080076]|uniref:hypothetical protein n=1 Tax=Paraburkholderia sp. NPDC080076 TaxID=3390605 RepID=UPI003D050155
MMPIESPPPPPNVTQNVPAAHRSAGGIEDMRDKFTRTTPPTPDDAARTREFIEGKIEMIRSDPRLSDAEKAAAIADLKAKR